MITGFKQFDGTWGENAQLAWDTIAMKPARGIPSALVHVMDIPLMEEISGHPSGAYRQQPDRVYQDFHRKIGTCEIDQYLADNPLGMSDHGYESDTAHGATTGAERIVCDGILIDSPEAVLRHLEQFQFPSLEKQTAGFDAVSQGLLDRLIEGEVTLQKQFGNNILKVPYGGFFSLPCLRYGQYGYINYFMAYALYPEIMAKDFRLQADLAAKRNAVCAQAILQGNLPRMVRLDHDMTDSRGTLVDIRSLDRIWFPQLARSIQPFLEAGIRLIWHCDGNIMSMVPRLIEVGIRGFQGFQYEDGVDYEAICRMTDRDGEPLMIWAGVSVTRTLPLGTKKDVVEQMKWLVKHGPARGLFLAGSSSIVPGTNRENIRTMLEGLTHYRKNGRTGR